MNRFLRTAYASTLAYLCLALLPALITGVAMPFAAFSCLYFGLLLTLLPAASKKLAGKEPLFTLLGAVVALFGFALLAILHCPLLHYFVHLAGILFAVAFLFLLRHRTTHADFKAKYQFIAVLVLIVIGFIYLSLLAGVDRNGDVPVQSENVRLAVNGIVPFAITLLMTGVLLLRGLRAQAGVVDERAFNLRQLRDTLIYAALVTVVFLIDPFVYLKKAVGFLLNDVLRPVASFLARLLSEFLYLISCTRPEAGTPMPTPVPTADPNQLPVTKPVEVTPEHYYLEGDKLTLTLSYIFVAITALILLAILAFQIRKLIKRLRGGSKNRGRGYPHETREALSPETAEVGARRPRKRSEDPRERIRYLYAEFLRFLSKAPIRIRRTDTCGEIERRAEKGLNTDPSNLSDLTELYEKARYRQNDAPTADEAARMKTLLARIRNSNK